MVYDIYKMWEMGSKGKMWRAVRFLYVNNKSFVFLKGKSLDYFSINQGVAQGYTFSPSCV